MNRLRNISKKGLLLGLLLVVLLGAGGVLAYNRFFKKDNQPTGEEINYRPPTDEEQAAGDKKKEEIVAEEEEQNKQPPPTEGTKKQATVIITDAGQYDGIIEVRSFVSDHYQDGTCTITFKQGSQTVTKQTPARTDVSTTICMNPLIKRSEFPAAGTWQVTVSYESKDARGTSESQSFKIN